MMRRFFSGVLCAALMFVSASAAAQAYPSRPIRFISPFPPGGGTDLVSRILQPRMMELLGQQIVLEHKTGAGGVIGIDLGAKAAADGYTILVANNTVVTAPSLGKTPYDAVKDFAPIGTVGSTAVALAVHPSFAAKSVAELVAMARAQPGKLSYSSCGNGSAMHLAGELFKHVAKVEILHVPYRGCAPAIVDGVSGQVPVLFNTITNTSAQAKGGRLRVLALASPTRSKVDSATPVISESAGFEGYNADIWFGLLAPAGTPPAIVQRLNAVLEAALKTEEVRGRLEAQLFDVRGSTPGEFATLIREDLARWSKLVKDASIKGE
ncbi:MAG: tripartite tricarboxylate transporter substrate binding protein [Betaproteobacteria bacterium]|nr:tripartite tricarboxylate transporter substrate binding protein [Betaproteobacteria bacterium]MSQ87751.1 tripartite tricarboxylate transporter substrate binding protein [Betaproteobacteria bacterium]